MIRQEKSHQLPSRPAPGHDTVKVESDDNPGVELKTDVSSMTYPDTGYSKMIATPREVTPAAFQTNS